MAVLDQQVPIFKYFEEISKIPRGSYHESEISNYLVAFANKYHLKYYQDKMNNVIIYKDGTDGYQASKPVMLQGHMDMVQEKDFYYDHDFNLEPLDLYIKDGYIQARGTTLGADDSYALSYMLAILASNDIAHPPLECVFTVQEEVGMLGARQLDTSKLKATRMIGLDTGSQEVTCVSSSGGRRVSVVKELKLHKNNWNTYKLRILGLLGGHSAKYISAGRGNANKIAFRMLKALSNITPVGLSYIKGGLKANAIARECIVEFTCNQELDEISVIFQRIANEIKQELAHSDPDFDYRLNKIPGIIKRCFDIKTSQETIDLIYLLPDGFKAKSPIIDNLTTISLNLGQVKLENNQLFCHYLIRSPLTSAREHLSNQIATLSTLFDAKMKIDSDYPGWDYEVDSKMRQVLKEVIKEQLNKDLIEKASHGGLEIGIFKGKIPNLDIVTLGPECYGAHTPEEKMNLDSFVLMFDVLKELLKRL